jgi:hypothetical protein
MAVSVSLPIKIRVDRTALVEHPCWVDEAVSSALGRALANSRGAVLDTRGGFVGVHVHQPTFAWSGMALQDRDRARFERQMSELIAEVAQREGVWSAPLGAGVPQVIPDDPSESYDDERGLRFLDQYAVDSYDGGQTGLAMSRVKPPSLFETVDVMRVVAAPDDPEIATKLDELEHKATKSQPLGVIFRSDAPGTAAGWQVIITDGDGVAGLFYFPAFYSLQFQGPNADPMFRNVEYVPSAASASAELIDLPTDPGQRGEILKTLLGDDYAWAVRRRFPKPVKMTTPQYNKYIDDAVTADIERTLARIGAVTGAVKVKMGGAKVVVWFTPEYLEDLTWVGSARLAPVTERIVRFRADKKGGEPGGQGTESSLRFPSERGGTGDCPKDDIPQSNWGGFMNEPALDEIGDAGVLFGKHMADIAAELGIEAGRYAGEFCCNSAEVLRSMADAVTDMDESAMGENKAAVGGGNMGPVDFTPGESTIIATIRSYAGTLVKISRLVELINDTFSHKEYSCAIHGMYRGRGGGWSLHFLNEVIPSMKWVVYHLFVGGCRSMLIQLLVTSENEIIKRQGAMDRYAPLFEKWILPEITDLAELQKLEKRLTEYQRDKYTQPILTTVTSSAPGQEWLLKSAALVAALGGPAVTRAQGPMYDVVEDGGIDKVRGANGVLWSKDDLVQALAIKRKTAEGIDPLLKQITDTPDAVNRFKGSTAIRAELEKLLAEMLDDNHEMQFKTGSRPMFGFGASQRNEDTPNATVPHSSYRLAGIHLLTHQAIGDAFAGRQIYGTGIDFLFGSEDGKAALKGFGLMVGIIALSVLVPGGGFLAFGVGVAAAKHELDAAYEKKRLYRALIDPDQVLSYAEVEVGLFVAWFGFVLSLIPEAGTVTRGLIKGGNMIVKGEVRVLGQAAARALSKAAAKELAEYAVKDLLEAFVKETVMNIVMGQIIEHALSPVIDERMNEASIIRPGAQGGGDGGELAFIRMIRSSEVL